jgi:hypothetical protein
MSQTYSATNAGSSQNQTLSLSVGFYSNFAGSLQLAASGSLTVVASVTGSTSQAQFDGLKAVQVPLNGFAPYAGNYVLALASSTSSTGNAIAAALSNVIYSCPNNLSSYKGIYGSASAVTGQAQFGGGVYSSTTTALPLQIPFSSIIGTLQGATNFPVVHLKNYTA